MTAYRNQIAGETQAVLVTEKGGCYKRIVCFVSWYYFQCNLFSKANKWGTGSISLRSPVKMEAGTCIHSSCSGSVLMDWWLRLFSDLKEHGNHSPRAWMLCHVIPFVFRVKLICHVLTLLSMLQIKVIGKQKPACRLSAEAAKVQTKKHRDTFSFSFKHYKRHWSFYRINLGRLKKPKTNSRKTVKE